MTEISKEKWMPFTEGFKLQDWAHFPPCPPCPNCPKLPLGIFVSESQTSVFSPDKRVVFELILTQAQINVQTNKQNLLLRYHTKTPTSTNQPRPGEHKCPHPCLFCRLGKGDQSLAGLPASNILGLIYGNRCLKHSQPSRH